jgi:hypothetical protein
VHSAVLYVSSSSTGKRYKNTSLDGKHRNTQIHVSLSDKQSHIRVRNARSRVLKARRRRDSTILCRDWSHRLQGIAFTISRFALIKHRISILRKKDGTRFIQTTHDLSCTPLTLTHLALNPRSTKGVRVRVRWGRGHEDWSLWAMYQAIGSQLFYLECCSLEYLLVSQI